MMRAFAAFLVVSGLMAGTVAASVEDEIRSRIAPLGEVCLEGEECGSAAAPAPSEASGPRSGEDVYAAVCQACHQVGVAGAPKTGEPADWTSRLDKGMETLMNHAINGFNAMPAKGGCANCPDEEIEAAVEYMLESVQ